MESSPFVDFFWCLMKGFEEELEKIGGKEEKKEKEKEKEKESDKEKEKEKEKEREKEKEKAREEKEKHNKGGINLFNLYTRTIKTIILATTSNLAPYSHIHRNRPPFHSHLPFWEEIPFDKLKEKIEELEEEGEREKELEEEEWEWEGERRERRRRLVCELAEFLAFGEYVKQWGEERQEREGKKEGGRKEEKEKEKEKEEIEQKENSSPPFSSSPPTPIPQTSPSPPSFSSHTQHFFLPNHSLEVRDPFDPPTILSAFVIETMGAFVHVKTSLEPSFWLRVDNPRLYPVGSAEKAGNIFIRRLFYYFFNYLFLTNLSFPSSQVSNPPPPSKK